MTAGSAHDAAVAAVGRYRRAQAAALVVGNRRAAALFERRAQAAERALATWVDHPALACTIEPSSALDAFQVTDGHGRTVGRASTLREAERMAVDHGFRVVDVTRCGTFA